MRIVIACLAICVCLSGSSDTQSSEPNQIQDIPAEFYGDYVLVSRTAPPENKIEDFKDHLKPFCTIETNRVILLDGEILHAISIQKTTIVPTNVLVMYTMKFEGKDYTWSISKISPYTLVTEITFPNRKHVVKLNDLWAGSGAATVNTDSSDVTTNRPSDPTVFKLLKAKK